MPEPVSPYQVFSGDEWSRLRASTPLPLDESELTRLRGLNDQVSLDEVAQIYLPLSRLLNLHVVATQGLYAASATFLGQLTAKVPFVIGIGGSVAVGKSTTARLLQTLLARWPNHPRVELVTTDGFLYPNQILESRGLMSRKGFPESYDQKALLRFMAAVKAGEPEITAPVYSHVRYDIVPDRVLTVRQPDIVIIEGLNVLQAGDGLSDRGAVFVSDYFDFSIYVDAEEGLIQKWFLDRFLTLRDTVFRDPESYFHKYAALTEPEAVAMAEAVWREINGRNLRDNILPTRERAKLILEKGAGHRVQRVCLRKL